MATQDAPLKMRRTGTEDYGRWMKLLIGGEPGAGKTLISSTFPNVLYASAEGGMMSVADRNVRTIDITGSNQLVSLRRSLDQLPNIRANFFDGPVDTIVIDTLDEMARILQKERLAETKKDALVMADWGWFGDQVRSIIRAFRNLEMHVIFTCHVKTQEDGETGSVTVKPAIQGQVGDELPGYVDLALLLQARTHNEIVNGENKRTVMRYLQTYPDPKHTWIKDRSGKLPMEFPVNFEDDYKRLDALIYGGRPEAEEAPAEPILVGGAPAPVAAAPAAPVAAVAAPVAPSAPAPAPAPVAEAPAPVAEAPAAALAPAVEIPPEGLQMPKPPETHYEPFPDESEEEKAERSKLRPPLGPAENAVREESVVPAPETPPAAPVEQPSGGLVCENCGGGIENQDQKDLSQIRFRKDLCRKCFTEVKNKK